MHNMLLTMALMSILEYDMCVVGHMYCSYCISQSSDCEHIGHNLYDAAYSLQDTTCAAYKTHVQPERTNQRYIFHHTDITRHHMC
jgi:hypothetical protein